MGRNLPYFPKKNTKNRYGHNCQNIASKMNQRWVIDYDPTLIRFGSDILKLAAMLVFLAPHFSFFFFWKIGSTSAARNSA